jgi:hypothetical protein
VTPISKAPILAEDSQTDLSFLLSLLTLGFDLFSVFLGAFTTIFGGFLEALGSYNELKNPQGT